MSSRGRPSILKRQKEEARRQWQKAKAERRAAREATKDSAEIPAGEDPDIAGIVPGPQPPRDDD